METNGGAPRRTTAASTLALALVLIAGTGACAPQALDRDRAPSTDGFMRAGGSRGERGSGGSGGASTAAGNGGASAPEGSAGSSGAGGSEAVDAPPRDARPLPPLSDAQAASCTNLRSWQEGTEYKGGQTVISGQPAHRFECKPWPYEGWCGMKEYEPAGQTRHWPDAWIDEGLCP